MLQYSFSSIKCGLKSLLLRVTTFSGKYNGSVISKTGKMILSLHHSCTFLKNSILPLVISDQSFLQKVLNLVHKLLLQCFEKAQKFTLETWGTKSPNEILRQSENITNAENFDIFKCRIQQLASAFSPLKTLELDSLVSLETQLI